MSKINEWTTICHQDDLTSNAGVCALFENEQVAIFFCTHSDSLYAVSNFDPIAEENVISRGIMGGLKDNTYVASPLYKQHFDLETGICLEEPDHVLKTYQVRQKAQNIQLKMAS